MDNPIPTPGATSTPAGSSKFPLGLNLGQFVGAISAIVVIVATFLPWAKIMGLISVTGFEGDGKYTLIAGIIALVLILTKKAPLWAALVLGLVVAVVGVIDINGMSNSIQAIGGMGEGNPFADLAVEIGIGLYLTVLGGLGLIAAPLINKFKK